MHFDHTWSPVQYMNVQYNTVYEEKNKRVMGSDTVQWRKILAALKNGFFTAAPLKKVSDPQNESLIQLFILNYSLL
jgi:hypothetical protein